MKFLREPLPREEELRIEAEEVKVTGPPKNATLGALGQKKLANAPIAVPKHTGPMVLDEESEDPIDAGDRRGATIVGGRRGKQIPQKRTIIRDVNDSRSNSALNSSGMGGSSQASFQMPLSPH